MNDYSNVIIFEENCDIQKVVEALKLLGYTCQQTTCYEASLKEEISQTLQAINTEVNVEITEEEITKIFKTLENNNKIWQSLEDAVFDSIEKGAK